MTPARNPGWPTGAIPPALSYRPRSIPILSAFDAYRFFWCFSCRKAEKRRRNRPPSVRARMFLGDQLLAYLVLAMGGALLVGNVLALVKPPPEAKDGELERAPVARSLVMAGIGFIAAVWAVASLLAG